MSSVPIYQDNGHEESFYVPAFEVKIGGRELAEDVVRDVMEVTYRDKENEIDSFELKINNWDATERKFKYVGVPDELNRSIFDPGQELELYMGYHGHLQLMLWGQITTLEPSYPASGAPSVVVRGLNVLHAFRKKQHTWAWEEIKDSDLAQEIGGSPVSENRPGLGIEVRVDDGAAANEPQETFLFMNNQYDIVFLLERARVRGYSLYVDTDEESGNRFLYFGNSDRRGADVTYELAWGQSLMHFRPTLTTANQISQVTVRGWDRRRRRAIEGTASLGDRGVDVNEDQRAVAAAVEGRHEVITDRPVHTPQQAERLARNILTRQLKEMVKGTGETLGLPKLRTGRKVKITKLGPRFNGEYFVTQTTHTISDSGYRTTFEARRERGLEGA